jgi:hypothetical protein
VQLGTETGHTASVLVIEPTSSTDFVYLLEDITASGSLSVAEYDAFTLRVGADYDLSDPTTIAASPLPSFSLVFESALGQSVLVSSEQLTSSLVPRRPVFHSVIRWDGTIRNSSLLRLETMVVPTSLLSSLASIQAVSISPSGSFPHRMYVASLQLVRY